MRRKQNIDVSYIFYDVEKKSRIKADYDRVPYNRTIVNINRGITTPILQFSGCQITAAAATAAALTSFSSFVCQAYFLVKRGNSGVICITLFRRFTYRTS